MPYCPLLSPLPSLLHPLLPLLLHCRYLSYISRLVAAEKPHSRSVRLRTLRITCVPLVDKERCVCVCASTHEREGVI